MKKNNWSSKSRLKKKKKIVANSKSHGQSNFFNNLKIRFTKIINFSLLLALIFTIIFILIFFFEKSIRVSQITINHPPGLINSELMEKVDVTGDILFFIDENQLVKNITLINGIDSVFIKKVWPNKLVIDIEYSSVALQINNDKGQVYYFNQNGEKISSFKKISDLPNISLDSNTSFQDLNLLLNKNFIRFIQEIEKYNLKEKIKLNKWNYVYNRDTGISITISKNQKIIFGNGEQLEFKIINLEKAMNEIDLNNIEFNEIDLRFNSKIVLR
jgi:cell division septal protein FtsQ